MSSSLAERILDLSVSIQQIPAPPFAEQQRALFVRDLFVDNHLHEVEIDQVGNVYARYPGAGNALPVIVSGHLDTVFPPETDLAVKHEGDRVYGAGIGDNSLGVAGLLGLVWALQQKHIELPGDLWLVANVGEEGIGDLRGMQEVVNRFGHRPQAYIVLEGAALGYIYHRGLSVKRYRITARTAGGHSWVNYGIPSAVHELAALVTSIAQLPLPGKPRSSLNVGLFSGGTGVNTIASEANLELDMRSETVQGLQELDKRISDLVIAAHKEGVNFYVLPIGSRPAGGIPPTHPLVQLAQRCLNLQGIQPILAIGSTDANIPLSLGYPAICLGLTTGAGAHTNQEYIDKSPIDQGLLQLIAVVEGIFSGLA